MKLVAQSINLRQTCLLAAMLSFTLMLIILPGFFNPAVLNNAPIASFVLDKREVQELEDCHNWSSSSKMRNGSCPDYFRWIHEDLSAWQQKGITEELMAEAKKNAHYHVVIVNGELYTETYRKCFQHRDNYTLWGILMLLRNYPGMVPDLELYGTCTDAPRVRVSDYPPAANRTPPPNFVYCTNRDRSFYDIVIPDWSFWSWPEVNIRAWQQEREMILNSSYSTSWSQRLPVAYWKGNKWMSQVRKHLATCNSDDIQTHNQDWGREVKRGFPTSNLSSQCFMRYKIYAEGEAWSVSLKYLMACGSTMLQIETIFGEFFARSFLPYVHYVPVSKGKNMCNSIKRAMQWGNANPQQAEAIARCARAFVEKQLGMEHAYMYMLHLLRAYAKLLRFKPATPRGLQPVTTVSSLPWHEVTLPNELSRILPCNICTMPPRDAAYIETIVSRQQAGYKKADEEPPLKGIT